MTMRHGTSMTTMAARPAGCSPPGCHSNVASLRSNSGKAGPGGAVGTDRKTQRRRRDLRPEHPRRRWMRFDMDPNGRPLLEKMDSASATEKLQRGRKEERKR